jgi:hypothetical protein
MKITDIAALILAVSTIGRFIVRQEEDEPQIQGLCKACESNPAPCCAKPNPVPPANVRRVAAQGLKNRRKFNRGGTMVGVARARDLSNGRNVSDDTIKRMRSFFARHGTPAKDQFRARYPESAASISWDLWGGDAGRRWVNEIRG